MSGLLSWMYSYLDGETPVELWIVIEDNLILGAVSSKEELSKFNVDPKEVQHFEEGMTLMRNNDGGPVTIQHCFVGKPIYQD